TVPSRQWAHPVRGGHGTAAPSRQPRARTKRSFTRRGPSTPGAGCTRKKGNAARERGEDVRRRSGRQAKWAEGEGGEEGIKNVAGHKNRLRSVRRGPTARG